MGYDAAINGNKSGRCRLPPFAALSGHLHSSLCYFVALACRPPPSTSAGAWTPAQHTLSRLPPVTPSPPWPFPARRAPFSLVSNGPSQGPPSPPLRRAPSSAAHLRPSYKQRQRAQSFTKFGNGGALRQVSYLAAACTTQLPLTLPFFPHPLADLLSLVLPRALP